MLVAPVLLGAMIGRGPAVLPPAIAVLPPGSTSRVVQMGLLDNHPETQQKTRTALACTLVACSGAFLGELLTIHVPALAAA